MSFTVAPACAAKSLTSSILSYTVKLSQARNGRAHPQDMWQGKETLSKGKGDRDRESPSLEYSAKLACMYLSVCAFFNSYLLSVCVCNIYNSHVPHHTCRCQRRTPWNHFSPSPWYCWRLKFRSIGLHNKHLYQLSNLASSWSPASLVFWC